MRMLSLLLSHRALWVLDVLFCGIILMMVPYTEVDWNAYMQEVRGYLNGELDYTRLQGDTGPLVYPGGFVYVYGALYYVTNEGRNVFLAQLLFTALYLCTVAIVFHLYRTARVPFAWSIGLILSRRMHSIFILRLFNDGVAMFAAYAALYHTAWREWSMGAVWFSFAVGVKMNVLLLAPGMLVVWLANLSLVRTAGCIVICAGVQLLLGWPFLATYPLEYLSKAFELSRVFTYKWTVNYKFLTETQFQSPGLGVALLLLTIGSWIWMWWVRWRRRDLTQFRNIVLTVMESSLIGIAFARTMHYQFYCWFFHQVPLVLCLSCTSLHWVVKACIVGGIEYAFSVYPSTPCSSTVLMTCLIVLWAAMMISRDVPVAQDRKRGNATKEE